MLYNNLDQQLFSAIGSVMFQFLSFCESAFLHDQINNFINRKLLVTYSKQILLNLDDIQLNTGFEYGSKVLSILQKGKYKSGNIPDMTLLESKKQKLWG